MAIGLSVPRPTIQLIKVDGKIRSVGAKNPEMDVTLALHDYADKEKPAHCRTLWLHIKKRLTQLRDGAR